MKKFFLSLFIILLAVLAFAVVGVLALTKNPVDDWQGTVELNPLKADVYVKQGNLDYQLIEENILLEEGDMVKTSDDGEAEILFGDGTVLRLSTDTEITINEASLYSLWEQYVNVSVSQGKVWFRIIKIFDSNSSWEVETPTVVATVRGTAFGIEVLDDDSTDLLVAESKVSVVDANNKYDGKEAVAEAGQRMKIAKNFIVQKDKLNFNDLKDQKTKTWIEKNLKADSNFRDQVQQNLNNEILKYFHEKPGTLLYEAQLLAENIRIALSSNLDRYELENLQQNRRLAEVLWLAEKGEDLNLQKFLERSENEFFLGERFEKIPQILIDPDKTVERLFDFEAVENSIFDIKTLENRINNIELDNLPTERLDFYLNELNIDDILQEKDERIIILHREDFDDFDLALSYIRKDEEILSLIKELREISADISPRDEKAVDAFYHSRKYLELLDLLEERIPGYNRPEEENQPVIIETTDNLEIINSSEDFTNPNEINLLNIGASAAE